MATPSVGPLAPAPEVMSDAELALALQTPRALPRDVESLEALAEAAGVRWLLYIPFAHPALVGMDALPTQLAHAIFRPRFRRLRLVHLLTGDVKTHELASFGGTKRMREIAATLQEVAQDVFVEQANAARERRRTLSPPNVETIGDRMLLDLGRTLLARYCDIIRRVAPTDPKWLGRTRTKEATPDAALLWEAHPPALERGQPVRVRIELERWRDGHRAITTSLGEGAEDAWFFPALFADALRHLVTLDQDGGARLNSFKRTLGVAPWERFVAALDAVYDPRDFEKKQANEQASKDERVVWIVHDRGGDVDLSAKVQKKKAATAAAAEPAFSRGKRASLKSIADGHRAAEAIDQEVARTLVEGRERTYLPPDILLDALEQLVDHPLVFDDDDRPVRVQKAPIELAVVEIPAEGTGDEDATSDHDDTAPASSPDLTLQVRVDGHREDPKELYMEAMDSSGIVRLWPSSGPLSTSSGEESDGPVGDAHRGDTLTLCRPSARACALLHALSHLNARFPASQADALLSRIPRLANDFSLTLPPSLRGRFVAPDTDLVARLHPLRPEGLAVTFGVRPLLQSGLLEPGFGTAEVLATENGERIRTERNLKEEKSHYARTLSLLPLEPFTQRTDHGYASTNLDASLDLLAALKRAEGVRIEWPDGVSLDVTRPATSQDLRVQVTRQRNWFGVDGDLELDSHQVGLALLFDALRERRRYIPLENGHYLALSESLQAKAAPLAALTFENKGDLEIGAGAVAAMLDLEEDGAKLDADASWSALAERLKSVESLDVTIPKNLEATLRPYQEEGVKWLLRLAHIHVGGVLADDMGLGKTVQALAVLLARAASGPALVVAPTSVGFNWEREAERFAPSLRVIRYRGKDREMKIDNLGPGDVVVTSYGLLQRDANMLAGQRFATVVFDEAQALKNASTKVARAARDLDCEWAFALSGTPVENHLGELWSIFRVVSPGLLGSWARFRERYARPIEVEKSVGRQRTLARALSPFLLRRTKKEVAPELPERTEVLLPVTLGEEHRALYEQARLSAIREFEGPKDERVAAEGEGPFRMRLLAAITRLRLCACHPQLLDPSSQLSSSKIDELVALLRRAKESGQRALVFSQFVRLLDLAKGALENEGLQTLTLQGSTPAPKRAALVDAFQAGEADAFLISLKAGGTGLNLTAADIVVHLDPWWNPATEAQATDRAHRIGRKKPLTIYRLVASETIEDEILSLHDQKRALAEGVWNDDDELGDGGAERSSGQPSLSVADLAELLRDPKAHESDGETFDLGSLR